VKCSLTPPASGLNNPLLLAWAGFNDTDSSFTGLMDLQRAKDKVEFRAAMLKLRGLSSSFLFADYTGDVGYWVAGQALKRQSIKESLYTKDLKHIEFLETNQNPHIFNPEKGFIVACSNKVSQSSLFLGLGSTFPGNSRAKQVHETLKGQVVKQQMISMENVKNMQKDVHSDYAGILLSKLLPITRNSLGVKGERVDFDVLNRLLVILEGWDHNMNGNSKGALVYNVWMKKLFELALNGSFTKEEINILKSSTSIENFIGTFIKNDNIEICNKDNLKGTCNELLVKGLSLTYDFILKNIGKNEKIWHWDYINTQDYYHPVYSNSWLSFLFHRKTRSGVLFFFNNYRGT
jgi:penicillin amidase